MNTTLLAAAIATLARAVAQMEAAATRTAYLLAVTNFHAAFDALEVLRAAQRTAPRF